MNELIVGYSTSEKLKIENHLKRLLPHIDVDNAAIVGGLAIRYGLINRGVDYPQRRFNDLDFVIASADVVSPTVTTDFLVGHHHRDNGQSYFALVDPESKTKVDIFEDDFYPDNVTIVSFEGYNIKIKSLEDQLVKTVYDTQRISPESKVDPKQFLDAQLMLSVVDINLADQIWKRKVKKDYPGDIRTAWVRADLIRQRHPEYLQVSPFRKSKPYVCADCIVDPNFPLTSLEDVYKILDIFE